MTAAVASALSDWPENVLTFPITLGSMPRRGLAEPWWVKLMPDDAAIHALARELAILQGQQTTHEKVCEERMVRIDERHAAAAADLVTLTTGMDTLLKRVDGHQQKAAASAWKLNWKAWAVAVSMISALVGALAWESGQLLHVYTAQVHASPPP